MRFKGQGRLTKYICTKIANRKKTLFLNKVLSSSEKFIAKSFNTCSLEIVSISGTNQFADQLLSIQSFIHSCGFPKKWVLYSDGSHTIAQLNLLQKLFMFLEIRTWDSLPCRYPEYKHFFDSYIEKMGIGKKTYIVLNHSSESNFLFADSDIVFYKNFKNYVPILENTDYSFYMCDNDWCCLDSFYMSNFPKEMYQLNSGLLYIQKDFDWSKGLEYMKLLNNKFEFFTDQTIMHIAFKYNKSLPFDPRMFKVEVSDHFKFGLYKCTRKLAARHYVSPIRHKMWQKGWKWHFE